MYGHLLKTVLWFVVVLIKSTQSTKWLIDNPGFNDPSAWIDDYLPCARENVIFPEEYQALLPLPKSVDVGGFVLPKDGAILLQQDSIVTLGGNSQERDCDKGKAYIKPATIHKWLDPKTWRSSKEQQENTAIPDMERVPCNNESVVIKSNGPLAIDLEYTPYLRLGQLSFAGSLLSKDYLRQLMYTDLGEYLFKNQAGVNIEYYHNDVCGCHKDFNTFTEPICHNVIDTCPRPHCLVPIVPYGSCCAICGTTLKFAVEYCEENKLHKLKNIIQTGLKEKSLQEELEFYVNFVNSENYGNFLQAVIVDRDSYAGKSVDFMKYLNETTNWLGALNLLHNSVYGFEFSGRPYNPNITFGSMLLIFLCLIFVSIVALVIFAYYYPDNRYLHYIPRWIYDPRIWRSFVNRPNNVFARFDNTRASILTVNTENVNKKQGFTMAYDPESGRVREQAFDNPMFGEMPSTSQAAREKETEDIKKVVPQHKKETADMTDVVDTKDEEEQELTEIKLESSSDDDDEEQETKE